MKIAQTERLYLRHIKVTDAAFICELLNSPGWLQYIGDRGVHTATEAAQYIQNRIIWSYQANGFGMYAMVLKDTGTIVGTCGLVKREGLDTPDIGFAMLPAYEGRGYTYEAALAVLELAKQLKLTKVAAITVSENTRSINLIKKLGLIFEKMIQVPNDEEELMLFGRELRDLVN